MNYMIFNSLGAAENAQHRVLKLWSQYLYLLGYGRDENFVVSIGTRAGKHVAVVTARWSPVVECEEGFAIIHPETHTFEDGVVFSLSLLEPANNTHPDSVYTAKELAKIGISPTPNLFGAAYTETAEITLVQEV